MADETTRLVRTAGVAGEFRLPGLLDTPEGSADLVITPDGVEVTKEQWLAVADAATVNHVIVRLDEDFPVAVEGTPEPQNPLPTDGDESAKLEETGTAVDGSSTPPATSSTGSTRKGR